MVYFYDAFKDFFNSYIETAIWSSNEEKQDVLKPICNEHTKEDLSKETLDCMAAFCLDFLTKNFDTIIKTKPNLPEGVSVFGLAGHDFWLTHNNHGSGFFDGDWGVFGKTLTESCEIYSINELYLGDDGQIHGTNPGIK